MLLNDVLKNADQLKRAMMSACKVILPADSSPQFRRGYELALIESACYDDLPPVLQNATGLFRRTVQEFERLLEDDDEMQQHLDSLSAS